MAPFLSWRSRGGSYYTHNHPGRSCEVASLYFLVATTSPWKGGECPRFQFIHTCFNFADDPLARMRFPELADMEAGHAKPESSKIERDIGVFSSFEAGQRNVRSKVHS